MKASVSPLLPAALAAAFLLPASLARSQDILVMTNGQRREGQILEVTGGRVRFKSGPAETAIPLEQVASARMAPPKAFEEAQDFSRQGNPSRALGVLKPLAQKFRGLPSPWAEQASALLGSLYLELGDISAAESAFSDFQAAYPKAQELATLGLARLAIYKKQHAEAESKIRPIVEQARKTLLAPSGKNAEFGQALHLMGLLLEEKGQFSEALEHHLLAATIFAEDAVTAAKAQARAEALAQEKKVAVP